MFSIGGLALFESLAKADLRTHDRLPVS